MVGLRSGSAGRPDAFAQLDSALLNTARDMKASTYQYGEDEESVRDEDYLTHLAYETFYGLHARFAFGRPRVLPIGVQGYMSPVAASSKDMVFEEVPLAPPRPVQFLHAVARVGFES